jgi:hypothetical protein
MDARMMSMMMSEMETLDKRQNSRKYQTMLQDL